MKQRTQYGSTKTVAVSGGFDPLHVGHLSFFKEAAKLGDRLIVFVDSDEFVAAKREPLMPQSHRTYIISEVKGVAAAYEAVGKDCISLLAKHRPDVYAVGIDHYGENFPELLPCRRMGIAVDYIGHEKSDIHSSDLLKPRWVNPPVTVDALIARGDELLLIRRGKGPGEGMLDLPGGFLDEQETLEEACVREVREEIGVTLRKDRLLMLESFTGRYHDGRQVACVAFAAFLTEEIEPKETAEASGFLWVRQAPPRELFFMDCVYRAVAAFFNSRSSK